MWHTGQLPSVVSAGLFVCPGSGIHGERVIDSCELIYVRHGVLGMVEGGRELIAEQGMTLLLLPGRTHRGLMPYEPDLSFYWVHFILPTADPGADRTLGLPQLARLSRPDVAVASCDRLLHAYDGSDEGEIEAALVLSLLLLDVVRAGEHREEAVHARAVVRRIDEYIAAHLGDPLSTSGIALALGYNPDYLSRVYREGSGRTITDGIHTRRVADARLALTQTTRTVDEIAYAVGYSDPGYFRRVFRRLTGTTPGAFRDMYFRVKINTR